jgi:hypothetical protein
MGRKRAPKGEDEPSPGMLDEDIPLDEDMPDPEAPVVEDGYFDFAKHLEEVVLTHADFVDTPMENLVPEDVWDAFDDTAADMEILDQAIAEFDRSMRIELSDDLKEVAFPDVEPEDLMALMDEEVTPVPIKIHSKIPDSVLDRLFTVRRKGWEGRIWRVTPAGATSGDETRDMSNKLVSAIASSQGYVVLSGKDYSVIRETTPEERKLLDDYRDGIEVEGVDREAREIEKQLKTIELGDKMKEVRLTIDSTYIRNLVENIILYGNSRNPDIPPEAYLIIGHAFASALLNGKVVIRDGWKDEVYPNIYAVVVGPPSTQKSSAFQIVKSPCKRSIPDIVYHTDWTKEALGVQFVNNPSGVIWQDEFAQILDPEIREGYKRGVLEFLIVIYDENEYSTHRIEDNRNLVAEGVNISFVGTIQTERFYRLVTEDDVNSGFFNRFSYIILSDRKKPPVQTRYTKKMDVHKEMIVKAFREVRKALDSIDRSSPVLMDFSDDALDMLNRWYEELDNHCRSYGGIRSMSLIAVASRIYTMAKKSAIVHEVLERISKGERLRRVLNDPMPSYQISVENMKKGIDFARICFKNSEYLYHNLRSTDIAVKLEKFKDIIRSNRDGALCVLGTPGSSTSICAMSRGDLLRYTAMKAREFEEYLQTFLDSGEFMELRFTIKGATKSRTMIVHVPRERGEVKDENTLLKHVVKAAIKDDQRRKEARAERKARK